MKDLSMKVMEISSNIQKLAAEQHEGEGMSNGDYQGAIEAQVMIAIQYGIKKGKEQANASENS